MALDDILDIDGVIIETDQIAIYNAVRLLYVLFIRWTELLRDRNMMKVPLKSLIT